MHFGDFVLCFFYVAFFWAVEEGADRNPENEIG